MAYENFYPGAAYSFEPGSDSLYTGATLSQGNIGASTGVQTANQLKDVADYLNQGMKTIEVSTINAEVFDMVPNQHLKEIHRLSKLTNAETTFHAPIIEPSGFTQQGWSEQNRELAEKQLTNTIIRANKMNPSGQMPVTIHASSVPGVERMPIEDVKDLSDKEKEEYKKQGGVPMRLVAVNQLTGELSAVKREKRYYPDRPEGVVMTPEKELRMKNASHWDQSLSQLVFYKERGDVMFRENFPQIATKWVDLQKKKISPEDLSAQERAAYNNVMNATVYSSNTEQILNSLYNEAYQAANPKAKQALQEAATAYRKELSSGAKEYDISARTSANQELINRMKAIAMTKGMTPEVYKPVEDFVKEKASKTLSNVAFNAYKKLGDKAPIVSIENPPYGDAMSSGRDLKILVEESRRKLAQKMMNKEGMNEKEANKIASKMIGVTWDTSHISMMRKQGFDRQQLIEEAKQVAPLVKHVHLNDNFGFSHTDLPPGMGDVPIKEIMKEFEKAGKKNVKHIFEGGNFFQHFKTAPHAMVLEAMGSPMYSVQAQPNWNGAYGIQGAYSGGYGPFLPEQHFSTYGSGFSGMPIELGGQIPGRASRFSGTPNV